MLKIGSKVKVISDNENYVDFKDKTLIVTHIAKNIDEHPGYDDGVAPDKLCDFITEDGEEVNCSLYEYEFEIL